MSWLRSLIGTEDETGSPASRYARGGRQARLTRSLGVLGGTIVGLFVLATVFEMAGFPVIGGLLATTGVLLTVGSIVPLLAVIVMAVRSRDGLRRS